MSDETIEQEIQDKGLTAPRISLAHVQAMTPRVEFRYDQPAGTTTTLCHAFLDGVFYLATGISACVSPQNFDVAIGEQIAQKKAQQLATDKLYELEGYRLWEALESDHRRNRG